MSEHVLTLADKWIAWVEKAQPEGRPMTSSRGERVNAPFLLATPGCSG
jgi:hypothetical protein